MTLLDGQHIRQSALQFVIQILKYGQHSQTVETVARTHRPRVDADKSPMFSVGCTW